MLEVHRTACTGACVCVCGWVGGGGKWWVHVCCVGVGVQETLLTICSLALLCVCLSVCLSVQGTPYDYHSPEATDLPYSTFSTLEHKRVHNVEPRYATPPPPVISERNEMHVVSLSSPPPMYGREDMV